MKWKLIAAFILVGLVAALRVIPEAHPNRTPAHTPSSPSHNEEHPMTEVTGEFTVNMTSQSDAGFEAGRAMLDKVYRGPLEAIGKGQMLSGFDQEKGSGAYVAIETVSGSLDGKRGSFALVHRGIMTAGAQDLQITVIPDSGTGELTGLVGSMSIRIEDGKHFYIFDYRLAG